MRAGGVRPGRARRQGRSGGLRRGRRCSTGSASTPLTITTAWSSETWPAAIGRPPSRPGPARGRGPGRWRARDAAWRRVWSAGLCWPSRRRCRRRRLGAEVEAVGVVGVAELELGDLVPQLGQGGQVGLGLGRAQGPQSEVGDLVELLGDGGDRGRDRVLPGVVECRCHTGNSGIGHRHSRTGNAAFPGSCGEVFRKFLERWGRGLDNSLAGARCSTTEAPLTLAARGPAEVTRLLHPPPTGDSSRLDDNSATTAALVLPSQLRRDHTATRSRVRSLE